MLRLIAMPTRPASSIVTRADHSTGNGSWSVRWIQGTPGGMSRSVIRPTDRTQTCRWISAPSRLAPDNDRSSVGHGGPGDVVGELVQVVSLPVRVLGGPQRQGRRQTE